MSSTIDRVPTARRALVALSMLGAVLLPWLVLGLGAAVVWRTGPDLPAVHPDAGSLDAVVRLGATYALGLCGAWLAAVLVLGALARVPGLTGRVARRTALRVTPAALRRAAGALLGLAVATGPHTTAFAAEGAPAPAASTAAAPGALLALALPERPAALPEANSPTSPEPATSPEAPAAAATGPRPATTDVRAVAHRLAAAEVVVHRGDTLWRIAADHLGPDATDAEIAAAWPQWWHHNAGVIGPDPALLLPGQVLLAPH